MEIFFIVLFVLALWFVPPYVWLGLLKIKNKFINELTKPNAILWGQLWKDICVKFDITRHNNVVYGGIYVDDLGKLLKNSHNKFNKEQIAIIINIVDLLDKILEEQTKQQKAYFKQLGFTNIVKSKLDLTPSIN